MLAKESTVKDARKDEKVGVGRLGQNLVAMEARNLLEQHSGAVRPVGGMVKGSDATCFWVRSPLGSTVKITVELEA